MFFKIIFIACLLTKFKIACGQEDSTIDPDSNSTCNLENVQKISNCFENFVLDHDTIGDIFCCASHNLFDCATDVQLTNESCSELVNSTIGKANSRSNCGHDLEYHRDTIPIVKCAILYNWKLSLTIAIVTLVLLIASIVYCCFKCFCICMLLPRDKLSDAILSDARRVSIDY